MELPPITSPQNRQISQVRRLLAKPRDCRREGCLVAEGVHLVEEALRARLHCRSLMVTVNERNGEIARIAEQAERLRLPLYRVLDHLFRSFSSLDTPQGVLGVFDRPRSEHGRIWARAGQPSGHLVIAHGLQDPGNIGAIARSALASGMRGIITTKGTVDPFHHRALRASQGAAFHLPILAEEPLTSVLARLGRSKYRTVALTPRGDVELTDIDPRAPTAFFLGAEGAGLDPAVEAAVDLRVNIPMQPGVESLGVAAAATVAFFWLHLSSRNGRAPHGAHPSG